MQIYTTKILKASALSTDTKALFMNWDHSQSVKENLQRFQQTDVFSKASRSRVKDILRIFKRRYLFNEEIASVLAILVQNNFSSFALNRIFYFFAALSDALLRDTVLVILTDLKNRGRTQVTVVDIRRQLEAWIEDGVIQESWSDSTMTRVCRHLLATLRDFEVLKGANYKMYVVKGLVQKG